MFENFIGRGMEAQSRGMALHLGLRPVRVVGSAVEVTPARAGDLLVR